MTHFADTAFPDGEVASQTLRSALAEGTPWTPEDAAEVNQTDLTNLPVREILIEGEHFVHDPDDSTSSHDPDGGVLVSADDKRFLSVVAPKAFVNVIARQNAQPDSPAPEAGDQYVIGPAPTGDDWAGHGDEFARFTSAGWKFRAPEIGERTYNRDTEKDIQWQESGEWTDADPSDDSIGPQELVFPFGGAAESQTDKPPASLISQGLGSAIGDMTANGGLAAAFDSNEDQAAASAAGKTSASDAFVGRDYSAESAQKIVYAEVVPSNDEGFVSGGPANVTLELYGKQGSAPANSTDGTLLGTVGPFTDTTDSVFVGSDDDDTAWDHWWVRPIPDSSGDIHIAEAKAFKSTTPAQGTLYIVDANAIGPWDGEDTNVAEANGADGWTFHAPYAGARLHVVSAGEDRQFTGTEWVPASGNFRRRIRRYLADDTWTKPDQLIAVEVRALGAGAGGEGSSGNNGNDGGDTEFGDMVIAGGGSGGGSGGSPGGSAEASIELDGSNGGSGTGRRSPPTQEGLYVQPSNAGSGGGGHDGDANRGGAGAYKVSWIVAADLPSAVDIVVDQGGNGSSGATGDGDDGGRGVLVVVEYIAV